MSARGVPNSIIIALNSAAEWFAALAASAWAEIERAESVKGLAEFIGQPAPVMLAGWTVEKAGAWEGAHAARLTLLVPDPAAKHPTPQETKTRCYMACGEVPFAGFHCLMACVTCTTEWGGGCRVSVYF